MEHGNIISSLRRGDLKGYEWLFTQYYARIKGFAGKLVRDQVIAEEIAQNVFLKLWLHRERITEDVKLSSYLYTIARNEVADHFRSKQRFLKMQSAYPAGTSENLVSQYDAEKISELIMQVVSRMPAQRRKVFVMSRIEEIPNAEIAGKLEISKRTVEKHLSDALKQIRESIGRFALLLLFFIS